MSTLSPPEAIPQARLLPALFHHRWAVPAMARLSSGAAAGRFAALARQLGVGRASLRRTLDALDERGLARRNPGYGHPLRPEYLLTDRGRALGTWCETFVAQADRSGVLGTMLRKWSTSALLAVHLGCERFSEIQGALPGVTARALTLALKDLTEAGLVERIVYDDYPPRVLYRLTRRAKSLAGALEELPLKEL